MNSSEGMRAGSPERSRKGTGLGASLTEALLLLAQPICPEKPSETIGIVDVELVAAFM